MTLILSLIPMDPDPDPDQVSECVQLFVNLDISERKAIASEATNRPRRGRNLPWMCPFRKKGDIASGYVKIAIENGGFIVDLPINNGDFQ